MAAITYTAAQGLNAIGNEILLSLADNTTGNIIGDELITDGDMAVLTGWSLLNGTGGGAITSSGGEMLFTQGATAQPMHAYQGISIVEGQTIVFDITNITGGFANLKISVGDSVPLVGTVYVGNYETKTLIDNKNIFITFEALTTGTAYVVISDEQATTLTSTWDDATARRGLPGLPVFGLPGDSGFSVGNGLMAFGTMGRSILHTDSETVVFNNYSTSNFWHQPYNIEFDPDTGAFHIRCWLKMSANTVEETIYERDSVPTAQRITLAVNSAGNIEFTCDDDTTARTATSIGIVDDDVLHNVVVNYDGAGGLFIYIDKDLDGESTGTALLTLTNTSAIVRWGVNAQTLLPLTNGGILFVGASLFNLTLSEISINYDLEEILFHPARIYTIVGNLYSLDVDLSQMTPDKQTIRNVTKTIGRNIKSLKLGEDHFVSITTLPVERISFDPIRRFLDSVDNAQPFTLDLYGTVIVPYDPYIFKIESDGYTENIIGADHISASFRVVR